MRCLKKNKQTFYYALFKDSKGLTDEFGNATGEFEIEYQKPTKCSANISAAIGESVVSLFGNELNYDKVIAVEKSIPIDETTVLWVGMIPRLDVNGELEKDDLGNIITPHNYIVTKVADSLNSKTVAISEVNVK